MKFNKSKIGSGIYVLSPLFLFFFIFIGSGLYLSLQGQQYAFYEISATVAILPAIILSVLIAKTPLSKTISDFLEGASDKNIIIMCLIYLLAGAFASVLQNMGGVTSVVHLVLQFVPPTLLLPALFLIAAFVSTAMGTSMGTIAAVGPIGVGIASSIGFPLPLTMGAIIGGAMFGDNLSTISDTSIAATQIHGCTPIEKLKSNIIIALPALLVTVIILGVMSSSYSAISFIPGDYQLVQCLPYFLVLGLAFFGVNVFVVLTAGILFSGFIGIITLPSYSLMLLSKNIFEGYKSMTEILILSLLMGGLGTLIKQQGGFSFLTNGLNTLMGSTSKRAAEASISAIAGISDICTANNTAAIILSGEAIKEIARENDILPARTATLVDLFACAFQGILPYSAQVLMAGSLANVSPLSIVPNVYYCIILGLLGITTIWFQIPLKIDSMRRLVKQYPA